jgi:putative selenium metabolism hydrolase
MTLSRVEAFRKVHLKETDWAISVLQQLISIPSLSGKEGKIIDYLQKLMKEIGIPEVRVDGFGNIIGKLGSGSPMIAFDAHVDTVDTGDLSQWHTDPFQAAVKNGRIYGRGAADQKGSLASILLAAKMWVKLGYELPCTVMVVGSVLEEDCDGLCWQYLIEKEGLRPDAVVLTEPTNLKINRGQRGRMEIDVTVSGVSCHGSEPEHGVNAISHLAEIVQEIDDLNRRLPDDKLMGKGTVTVTNFQSKSPSLCAVPDYATIHLDRRLTQHESPEQALQQIKNLSSVRNYQAKVSPTHFSALSHRGYILETDAIFPTWVLPEDHYLVKATSDTYCQVYQEKPTISCWRFSTNGVATCGKYHIPSIGFGPGVEAEAHKANENIAIADVTKGSLLLAELLWIFSKYFRKL